MNSAGSCPVGNSIPGNRATDPAGLWPPIFDLAPGVCDVGTAQAFSEIHHASTISCESRAARAALRDQNSCLQLRDYLGTVFDNEMFAPLFPERGQPAAAPWRLALVTVLQFSEGLSDRDAADAVRSRIDWKYLLGLELGDPSFDYSILSRFRDCLIEGRAEMLLLQRLLAKCKESSLIHGRSDMRTDATHVVASIRNMNRSELVGETLRAALNVLAAVDPIWLSARVDNSWYLKYARRFGYPRET